MTQLDLMTTSRSLLEAAYAVANIGKGIRGFFLGGDVKRVVARTGLLRGSKDGQRCYILGNGPSLRTTDVGLLAQEQTIVVNFFQNSPLYDVVNPTFHCACDPNYYHLADGLDELIACHPETTYVFAKTAIPTFAKHNNCFFLNNEYTPTPRIRHTELSRMSNCYLNVLGYTVALAIYLGYSEVILLGFDFNQFAHYRREVHFYPETEEVLGAKARSSSLFGGLWGYALATMQLEYLRDYALAHEVSILNGSPESLLDVFPFVELDENLMPRENSSKELTR